MLSHISNHEYSIKTQKKTNHIYLKESYLKKDRQNAVFSGKSGWNKGVIACRVENWAIK